MAQSVNQNSVVSNSIEFELPMEHGTDGVQDHGCECHPQCEGVQEAVRSQITIPVRSRITTTKNCKTNLRLSMWMSLCCPERPNCSGLMMLALKSSWLKIKICGLGMSPQLLVMTGAWKTSCHTLTFFGPEINKGNMNPQKWEQQKKQKPFGWGKSFILPFARTHVESTNVPQCWESSELWWCHFDEPVWWKTPPPDIVTQKALKMKPSQLCAHILTILTRTFGSSKMVNHMWRTGSSTPRHHFTIGQPKHIKKCNASHSLLMKSSLCCANFICLFLTKDNVFCSAKMKLFIFLTETIHNHMQWFIEKMH